MKNIAKLVVLVIFTSMLAGCIKSNIAPFNSNHLTVTFNNKGPKYLTQDITVNPGDSIQFNYTVTSDVPMRYVYLVKNDAAVAGTTDTIKANASTTSFNGFKKIVADLAPGVYSFRINAKDDGSVYLGTSATIKVTVKADFNYYIARRMMVPDTTAKTNPCYFSSTTGELFSYSTVGTNSGKIDFGYYYDPTIITVGTTPVVNGHTIYALNVSPSPVSMYDISSFTKNATVFKVPASTITFNGASTSVTFATLTSGVFMQAVGAATFTSGATSSINHLSTSASTSTTAPAVNFFMFKTAAGKYGAVSIVYVNGASTSSSSYMNIEVKIQN